MELIEQDGQFHGVKVVDVNYRQMRNFNSLKWRYMYIQSVISKVNESFRPNWLDLLQGLNKVLNPKCMQIYCRKDILRNESANPIL